MKVLARRDDATKHTVSENDTLETIVTTYKGKDGVSAELTWEEVALYNWATRKPAEVTRALCERFGSKKATAVQEGAEPQTLVLDPAFGPKNPAQILIPKVWKSEVALEKTHVVTVRKRTRAST